MKIINILLISLLLASCSFDNKTGIWKNDSQRKVFKKVEENNKKKIFQFKKIIFAEEKKINSNHKVIIDEPTITTNWLYYLFNDKNHIPHVQFSLDEKLLSSIKSNSKSQIMPALISDGNNLIYYNQRGEIFIYSVNSDKIKKFNFYKNKIKKLNKKLYISVQNNNLYVADSLGYLYSYDLTTDKLLWAKNYGIPFRSEIRLVEEQIIITNQDNELFMYNIYNGDIISKINLKSSFIKSKFENSLVIDDILKNVIVYTTDGEIYSINYKESSINWVLHLKTDSYLDDTQVFINHPAVLYGDDIFVGTNNQFLNIKTSGLINWEVPIPMKGLPLISGKYVFLLSQQNFLICLNKENGEIIWSKDVINQTKKYNKKIKVGKKNVPKGLFLLDNKISIFFLNGFVVNFNFSNGEINSFLNLNKKIHSQIIIFDKKLNFLSNKKILEYK